MQFVKRRGLETERARIEGSRCEDAGGGDGHIEGADGHVSEVMCL